MLMGQGNYRNVLYITDFGLAKQYYDTLTRAHIPFADNKNFKGTPRYSSLNAHRGSELSRRNDLESCAYMLIYLCKGRLPWQRALSKTSIADNYRIIYETKRRVSVEELCANLPEEFAMFLKYARNLSFEREPNYNYLRKLLFDLFRQKGYVFDYIYDWTEKI